MESKHVLFLFSLLILGLVADATSTKRYIGGYELIKDLKDPYVVEIAKFAVKEHDKTKSSNLVFVNVVSGEKHVISRQNHTGSSKKHVIFETKYKLNINATIPNAHSVNSDVYRVVVHDKPSAKYRSLISFKKVEKKN